MDTVSKKKRSWIMSRIRSTSSIEVLPKELRGLGLRAHPKGVFGKPDFGNKTRKIAVFIDGCFWHKCPEHFKMPKSNVKFWKAKIRANVKRDRVVDETLLDSWWTVIRIWEHEVRKSARANTRRGTREQVEASVV